MGTGGAGCIERPFDAVNYLGSAADQADLLSDAVDSGDPRYIASALGAGDRAGFRRRKGCGGRAGG